MYCNKCGAQLPEGSKFCLNCGAPVPEAPAEPKTGGTAIPKTVAAPEADSAPAPAAPQARRPKPVVLFLAVCAVVAVVLVVRANLRDSKYAAYDSDDSVEGVVLPDLTSFGQAALTKIEGKGSEAVKTWDFQFPIDNLAMMEEYAALLEKYDFTPRTRSVSHNKEGEDTEIRWAFGYTGPEEVEPIPVKEGTDWRKDSAIWFTVSRSGNAWKGEAEFSRDLGIRDTGERYSGQTDLSAFDRKPGPDAPTLPDLGAFAGIPSSSSKEDFLDGEKREFFDDFCIEDEAIDAYVKLLTEHYDFKLRSDEMSDISPSLREITLDYDGPADGDFTLGSIFEKYYTIPRDYAIQIWGHVDEDWFFMMYAPSLNYTDTGDRYGQ